MLPPGAGCRNEDDEAKGDGCSCVPLWLRPLCDPGRREYAWCISGDAAAAASPSSEIVRDAAPESAEGGGATRPTSATAR